MPNSTQPQLEGKLHEVKGDAKKKAGELTNDPALEAEGRTEKIAGTVQKSGRRVVDPATPGHNPERRMMLKTTTPFLLLAVLVGWATADKLTMGGPLRELHFSPDGRYIFAQDDAEITVLTAQPLAILFRIPAMEVRDAQFTPDSRRIVFIRAVSQVERWSVADRARISVEDSSVTVCGTERLSPDGRFLACVDRQGTLRLLDVATGAVVLERKKYGSQFVDIHWGDASADERVLMDPSLARVDFSPDGRFFLAAPAMESYLDKGPHQFALDLQSGGPIRLRRDLTLIPRTSLDYWWSKGVMNFAFVTPGSLMICNMFWAKGSVVAARMVEFPSGKGIGKPKLPIGPLFRAADPAFVIIRPFGPLRQGGKPHFESGHLVYGPPDPQTEPVNPRAAAAEISTGQVIISESPALDVFHNNYIAEPSPGEVGFYERGKGLQATIALHQK